MLARSIARDDLFPIVARNNEEHAQSPGCFISPSSGEFLFDTIGARTLYLIFSASYETLFLFVVEPIFLFRMTRYSDDTH